MLYSALPILTSFFKFHYSKHLFPELEPIAALLVPLLERLKESAASQPQLLYEDGVGACLAALHVHAGRLSVESWAGEPQGHAACGRLFASQATLRTLRTSRACHTSHSLYPLHPFHPLLATPRVAGDVRQQRSFERLVEGGAG